MKKLLKYAACLAILAIAAVLMTSCTFPTAGKVIGGGYFMNEGTMNPDAKCTFGFNAQGDGDFCEGFEFKGQFQFNDHVDNKIHLKVMELREILFVENALVFSGMDGNVEVWVRVDDLGQPGPDNGDYIKIWYDKDPRWNDPDWEGALEGGNIKIH